MEEHYVCKKRTKIFSFEFRKNEACPIESLDEFEGCVIENFLYIAVRNASFFQKKLTVDIGSNQRIIVYLNNNELKDSTIESIISETSSESREISKITFVSF
jgi:hypothetical protein